jgi:hypothetical protein
MDSKERKITCANATDSDGAFVALFPFDRFWLLSTLLVLLVLAREGYK